MSTLPAEIAYLPEDAVIPTAPPPLRGKRLKLAAAGRVCRTEGCATILRRSNLGELCAPCELVGAIAAPAEAPPAPRPKGITINRAVILAVLPATASEIADRTGFSMKALYVTLNRMLDRGLIERTGRPGRGHGAGYVYRKPTTDRKDRT